MDKKLFFWGIVLGVVISTGINFAFHRRAPFHRFDPKHRPFDLEVQFAKRLKLTDPQREQLKPLIKEFDQKLQTAREKQFAEVRGAMDDLYKNLAVVLDPEQTKRLEELRKKIDRFRPMGGGPRWGPPSPEHGPPPPDFDGPSPPDNFPEQDHP